MVASLALSPLSTQLSIAQGTQSNSSSNINYPIAEHLMQMVSELKLSSQETELIKKKLSLHKNDYELITSKIKKTKNELLQLPANATEYGILFISLGFFGIIALFSKSSFRIAPSILFGLFLVLASIAHWSQLENHILPMLSRHYLVIIFDILTSVVLFYHAWKLKSLGLLDNLVYTEVNSSY